MKSHRDYGFIAIVTFVVAVAIWLLLMPLVPAIASATLHRFHLRNNSFVSWAIQFPIPAMYNFANRYQVRDRAEDPQADFDRASVRMVNHFPSRIFTFADGRYMYLRHGEDRWLTIESSYRGQSLRSHFHAEPRGDGGFDLHRIESSGDE